MADAFNLQEVKNAYQGKRIIFQHNSLTSIYGVYRTCEKAQWRLRCTWYFYSSYYIVACYTIFLTNLLEFNWSSTNLW